MSKPTKKVVNGKLQFLYLGERISASKYYQLRYEIKNK